MDLYQVPLSMSLLGFRMGTMLTHFHMFVIGLLLRTVLNLLVRNASPRGHMCIIIIIIIFIRINNYTYRVHIKHLSTNYIKIFRIENKLYYNNYFYKIIVIQYNI